MKNMFDELYELYFIPAPQLEAQLEIKESRKLLSERLGKAERKLVLGIIDAQNFIYDKQSSDSFACGFRLAWRLLTQLNQDENDCVLGDYFDKMYCPYTKQEKSNNKNE